MAFSKKGIARIGSSQIGEPLFTVWVYNGNLPAIDDSLATIKASGYFNSIVGDLTDGDRLHLASNDGSDLVKITALTPNVTVESILATLPPASVTLAELSAGITPSHVIKFAAKFTTLGGAATEAITVTGALATDLVVVTMETEGAVPVTILSSAITGADTLSVKFSADPSTDTVITYQIFRAAS